MIVFADGAALRGDSAAFWDAAVLGRRNGHQPVATGDPHDPVGGADVVLRRRRRQLAEPHLVGQPRSVTDEGFLGDGLHFLDALAFRPRAKLAPPLGNRRDGRKRQAGLRFKRDLPGPCHVAAAQAEIPGSHLIAPCLLFVCLFKCGSTKNL
jgi:hypothetical protein